MEILINGMEAALKKGTSFQFITENRYFTGSDSYTLSIAFPLQGCSKNLRIFGNIGRMDVSKEKVRFDCEIRDGSFYKFGTITITSITPEEVKTQFLEGRSEQNFADDLDEIYINELDLGVPDSTQKPHTPNSAWNPYNFGLKYVALPWVNNTSGNIQNKPDYKADTKDFVWNADASVLSYQPYLVYIISKVAEAVRYTIDISEIMASEYRWLLICNTLPAAWNMPEFARALPHWSVSEFFEELEKLLNGEFTINHRSKSISFAFTRKVLDASVPVEITKVIDSYTTEISKDEDQCEFQEAANIKYADPGHGMWKFADCPWLINAFHNYRVTKSTSRNTYETTIEDWVIEYNTFKELHTAAYALKDSGSTATSGRTQDATNTAKILYAKDIDTYFTFYTLSYEEVKDRGGISSYKFHMCLLPLNVFGERIFKEDNSNTMELKIVPAWIDYTDAANGDILFLDCGSLENADESVMLQGDRGGRAYLQPNAVRICQNGDKNKSEEYFDKIFVGFYDGYITANTPSYPARPVLDAIDLRADWSYIYNVGRNLRLNSNANSAPRPQRFTINTEQKFTFSFLAHHIPDVRALFFINGHRYVCEKITSTFSESGMSELQKGTFYEVLDYKTYWEDMQMK